jgi:hypothetical protein
LQDHCFDGKAVFPAVEALITLASAVKSHHPQAMFNHLAAAHFPKILAIPSSGERQNVQIEIAAQESAICASLLTLIHVKNSTIRRTLEHAKVTFVQQTVLPEPEMSFQAARKLENEYIRVPAVSIYRELIPFGLSYQNIIGDLSVSPEGALADISGGGGDADDSFLGSPFVLDAAMHAACVFGQRFAGIVPFPVGFDERIIYTPTRKGATYLARIAPVDVTPDLLIFDAWIFDQNGAICEGIRGLRMRDITQGRLKPPAWIKEGA